jgi:Calx-beta domain/Right handed beta helix region
MAIFSGSLGRATNYTNDVFGLNNFQNEWITASQSQGVAITGTTSSTFNGIGPNLSLLNFSTNPPQNLGNLALTNLGQAGNDTFASIGGIGVADSYDGWYNSTNKIRAEINHNPNNGESQVLTLKWADNKTVQNATIDLSAFSPRSLGGDEGNEVGLLQAFNNGVPVSFTSIFRLDGSQSSITPTGSGAIFTADRSDGDFKFNVSGNFDELRFSARPYSNPTAAYLADPFKEDGSDFLLQQITFQGEESIATPPGTLQFSSPTFSVNENGTPIAAVTVTRTGGSTGAVSATVNPSNGTATALDDYTNSPISVNFANGDTAPKTVTIPIVDDISVEGNETVNLSLGSPTGGATIGAQNTATLNIVDNDVAPSKPLVSVTSFLDPTAGEPLNPQGDGLFLFTRIGGDLSQPLTIRYTVTGTATPNEDYAALLGTVTINAGDSVSDPVTVFPFFDFPNENEPTESVIVKVAEDPAYQVNRVGSADTASVSILDDDPLTGTAPNPVLRYDSGGFFLGGFSNITNAVAAANPNDIIVAKAGTYNEPGTIVIDKPLTLRGPNEGLSPSGTRPPEAIVRTNTQGQPVFQIAQSVNDVTIEGFTIQMKSSYAIQQLGLGSGTDIVIRQNTFTGIGPNSDSVISLNSFTALLGFESAEVIDNLISSVTTAFGSNTNGIQASQFDKVRITDNQIANLTGAGIVADSITDSGFGLPSAINSNKVSNVRQDGIRLQGGNSNIENNDITNANTSDALTRGGIRLQDSSLPFGGLTLGTVGVLSNVIINSVNGVAIAGGVGAPNVRINYNDLVGNFRAGLLHDRTVPVDATENWWDSPAGPIVGGIGPNRITGAGAGFVTSNPFATSVL